jgi:hypothetical protein
LSRTEKNSGRFLRGVSAAPPTRPEIVMQAQSTTYDLYSDEVLLDPYPVY